MDQMTWIYLIAAAVVVVFGIGVVAMSRRRSGISTPPAAPQSARVERPPADHHPVDTPAAGGVATRAEDVDVADADAGAATAAVGESDSDDVADADVVAPASMRERLARARGAIGGALGSVLGRPGVDDAAIDEIEEALLLADLGVEVTMALLDPLRERVRSRDITSPAELVSGLRADMLARLHGADRDLHTRSDDGPSVWLVVGVNGVGKTTTIGKLSQRLIGDGHMVLLAAGDTFRAAAAEQLGMWAERSGAQFVRGAEGGDPSSVIFDGVEAAAARGVNVVLADTAGRLHTRQNLMDELSKVRRVAEKGAGEVTETLLVIDATTGQNGLVQAREFAEATAVTGVVVTKLDGSAKGGIVFAIETELGIPVKLVGIGEGIADLVPFDPEEFVEALIDQ
ncbi:MAG: signal recognition particle-docking protein FtsY [Actinomycetota bacterium]|nr:signal recognition particle-docking protein FtsY [Actinomycetota bacterium]MDA3007328.1 signal recognition particle-docking protein FtsY [Actinomycetota bacterium]MDA3034467.1 signal recognition particle-docking protein FtsY [Actinomycetota bacterium]